MTKEERRVIRLLKRSREHMPIAGNIVKKKGHTYIQVEYTQKEWDKMCCVSHDITEYLNKKGVD